MEATSGGGSGKLRSAPAHSNAALAAGDSPRGVSDDAGGRPKATKAAGVERLEQVAASAGAADPDISRRDTRRPARKQTTRGRNNDSRLGNASAI